MRLEPWRGSPYGLQNLRAIAVVICQKPLSISGCQRGMIDEVVEFVASRALSRRTSRSYGCTKCKG